MDTEKCKVLILAVKLKSMSAAAQAMGYTPSGVARMIDALEAELNIPIIHRTNQGIALTKDGARVMPALKSIVQNADTAHQIAGEIRGVNIGSLSVGSLFSISSTWLPTVIKAFSTDYPNIHLYVVQDTGYRLADFVRNNQIDCGIISHVPDDGEWVALGEDRMVALVPEDSRYADYKSFPIQEFNGAPFINVFPKHNDNIDAILRRNGVQPDIRFSVEENHSAYAMVEAGLGISLNNEHANLKWQGRVKSIPLDPPTNIPIGIYVTSLQNASPAVKKFISYARKYRHLLN